MLFMLISAALAAPAVDELSALTQEAGPVVGAVSCAPLDAVLDGLRGSAILKGVLARPELQEAGSALFRDLLDPARTQGLGLDLQGSFSVIEAGGVETTRVSFSGTPAQAEALLPDAKGSPWTAAGPAAWTHAADESRWTEAHLEVGKLVMARRSKRGGEAALPFSPAVLANLPHEAGCAAYLGQFPKTQKGPDLQALGLWIPMNSATPAIIQLRTASAPPAALRSPPRPPVGGTSRAHPLMVATFGTSITDLLQDPAVIRGLHLEGKLPEAKDDHLRLEGGTTLALFAGGGRPRFVFVQPLNDARGRPIPSRKLKRLARRVLSDFDGELTSDTTFRFKWRSSVIFGAFSDGRVVAGTDEAAVEEAAQGIGEPWLSDDQSLWAQGHPLSAQARLEAPFLSEAINVRLGLSAQDTVWRTELQVSGLPDLDQLPPGLLDALRMGLESSLQKQLAPAAGPPSPQ